MKFNKHWELEGKHAFLSASKYHWINYDTDRLISAYNNFKAKERGTRLHEFACEAIKLGVKYAIGFGMTPELILYYSDNCFGTADAISFDGETLRIHDLKTGQVPASFRQLEVYTALFCLEYDVNPSEIDIYLRIYQSDEVLEETPELDDILAIMETIIEFDRVLDGLRKEG